MLGSSSLAARLGVWRANPMPDARVRCLGLGLEKPSSGRLGVGHSHSGLRNSPSRLRQLSLLLVASPFRSLSGRRLASREALARGSQGSQDWQANGAPLRRSHVCIAVWICGDGGRIMRLLCACVRARVPVRVQVCVFVWLSGRLYVCLLNHSVHFGPVQYKSQSSLDPIWFASPVARFH